MSCRKAVDYIATMPSEIIIPTSVQVKFNCSSLYSVWDLESREYEECCKLGFLNRESDVQREVGRILNKKRKEKKRKRETSLNIVKRKRESLIVVCFEAGYYCVPFPSTIQKAVCCVLEHDLVSFLNIDLQHANSL
jgi:hypothetical protein